MQITEASKTLFIDLVNDSGNWNGTPLFGGNVGDSPADKGNLTHLKKLGLVRTETDYERKDLAWVFFTEAGVAYAAELGLTIRS